MIWLVLAAVVPVLFWYAFIKPNSFWSDLGVTQTKPWPLFGDSWNTVFRRRSFCEFVEYIYTKYPKSRLIGFYQFSLPTLMIKDPEILKQITVKDFDHFTDHRSFIDPEADPLWGGNLFALKGQHWREMRATLSGSFTSSKMKNMFHLMEEAAENFVEFFLNKNEEIMEVEMKDIYTRYTNDVIATTAFGIKVDSLKEPENEFYEMGRQVTNLNGWVKNLKFAAYFVIPKISRWLKLSVFDEHTQRYFKSIINDTIETREKNNIVRPDMINLLLECRKGVKQEEIKEVVETGFATVKESDIGKHFKQNKNLSNDDITSQALIFFFAGFDTISTAMCFGSYELALNKEIQDKLRKEITETFEETKGKLTYEALLKMKYMDMVVSEILRKWPPAVAVDRVVTKPYTIQPTTPGESSIPLKVGNVVWIPIHGMHRDPEYFPKPEKFDPERFSDQNKDSIRPYTYMPFGLGPRNCIGSRFALLETKALLFNLLLNFEIVPTKKTQVPLKLNKNSLNHTAEGGFWFGLKRVKN